MLEIERLSIFKPRYLVRDGRGHVSLWHGAALREGATADIDGQRYELRREGRKRFVLSVAEMVVAVAERAGQHWTVSTDGESYVLRRRSTWRSTIELRSGDEVVGSVRRVASPRGKVMCELPDDLPLAVQAFIGFVVMAIWRRAAASAGGAAASTTAATGG
jgi:hypothetical protein